jgi:hypothetical protein
MTKEEKFAEQMSDLLYELRSEDLNNTMLFDSEGQQIPVDFIDKVLESDIHKEQMKLWVRLSVLEGVQTVPSLYTNENGEYRYNSDVYDHAYLIDSYIQERYEDTQTKTLYICSHCNSDNVQVKAWVRPNQGHAFVDEVNEGYELGWCDDCQLSSVVDTVELKRSAKVVGFQVVGEDGTPQEGEIHPHMDASFCLYSLPQAQSMLDDDNNGDEQWRLMTIWSGDVEEPTMMFEGDPRDPDAQIIGDGIVG